VNIKEKIKKMPVLGTAVFSFYMALQAKKRHMINIRRVRNLKTPVSPCIYYLDVPIHANLGDNAQYFCIKEWIQENYKGYSCVEIDGLLLSDIQSGIIEKLKKMIKPSDLIFFQSGYCTQDLGGYHDLVHRLIVDHFPNTPIVMLPQTVFYQSSDNANRTAQSYSKHKKIYFLARDFTSAKIAQTLFKNLEIRTYPDIVTTMIGSRKTDATKRDGVIFCIRNDSEKYYTSDQISNVFKRVAKKYSTSFCDTSIATPKNQDFIVAMREKIDNLISDFSKAKVIVTDRYHGTILSLVAGTPVVVIKTTDHKVKTGVEWFKGVYDRYVYYCDSLEEAEKKIDELYVESFEYQLSPYFKEKFYDSLKQHIDKWLKEVSD